MKKILFLVLGFSVIQSYADSTPTFNIVLVKNSKIIKNYAVNESAFNLPTAFNNVLKSDNDSMILYTIKYESGVKNYEDTKNIKYLSAISKGKFYYESLNYGYKANINKVDNGYNLYIDLNLIKGHKKYTEYGANNTLIESISYYNFNNIRKDIKITNKDLNSKLINLGAVNYDNIMNGVIDNKKEFGSKDVKDANVWLAINTK